MTCAMQTHEHGLRSPLRQPGARNAARELGIEVSRLFLAEMHAWLMALSIRSFYGFLAVLGLALFLAVQLPLSYVIQVGKEEGYGSDLPHLSGFNTAERDVHGAFRWTKDGATVRLPGLGQRPVLVQLDFLPINAQVAASGPEAITVWSHGERLGILPVRADGANYVLAVPARLLHDGTLTLTLQTETFTPPGDPRQLGTPLGRVHVTAVRTPLPILPDWRALGGWLLAALLFWVTLLRALGTAVRSYWWARMLLAGAIVLVVLAALFDPPRWAFGAGPALLTLALCYGVVLVLRLILPVLAARFAVPLDARMLGWLVLVIVATFGLRYGGRLYPNAMHGDIGFHTNRFNDTLLGLVYLLSRNRGVDFPYPSGPYLALAPFTLVGFNTPGLLQFGAALVDGLSTALVFALVAWTGQAVSAWKSFDDPGGRSACAESQCWYMQTALLAAAIYGFTAAGFMTTWWSFSTHIYTQFVTLLLITALTYSGMAIDRWYRTDRYRNAQPRGWWSAVICVLLAGVFLGHFGFFINTTLLVGMLLTLIWLAAWRSSVWAQMVRWPLTLAYAGALLIAGLFFYSAYLLLFMEQARTVAMGGLTELAQRAPVERSYLWRILWGRGLVTHFGFFPVMLTPLGLWALWRWGRPARVLLALMAGSLLVSTLFAILPFITLSTQSTRWLMFSAWVVAIAAALAARLLWRFGRAGQVVVLAMAGFVVWNTATLWLGAMIWRIRPPEPF